MSADIGEMNWTAGGEFVDQIEEFSSVPRVIYQNGQARFDKMQEIVMKKHAKQHLESDLNPIEINSSNHGQEDEQLKFDRRDQGKLAAILRVHEAI